MSVCVLNTSLRNVSLLIMQAAMGVQVDKNNITKIKHCSYVQGYRQQMLWIVTLDLWRYINKNYYYKLLIIIVINAAWHINN